MWLGGKDAISHDVYFGQTSGSLTFQGNQANNIFAPGALTEEQTYYWRIDTVTAGGTITGDEWSFTVQAPLETFYTDVYPIADTYTRNDKPTNNYGGNITLSLATRTDGSEREGYMKFDVNVPGTIISANLNLYATGASTTGNVQVYSMTDTSWDEMTMNYNNAPPIDGVLLDQQDIYSLTYRGFNVFNAVGGNGIISFGLDRALTSSFRGISARENANPPYLTLAYNSGGGGDPQPDPPANLVAVGSAGQISLDWDDNTEPDLDGYQVLRRQNPEDNFAQLHPGVITASDYVDTTMLPDLPYQYIVKAVDTAGQYSFQSNIETATATSGGGDIDPPTPDPATFAVAPAADSDTAISMTATTGSDSSGPVEYLFTETSGNPGATSSSWQTSTSYIDTGLNASTQYTYTVTMRDSLGNTGTASAPANATTQATPDTDPPTPNPATFAVAPAADSDTAISMTATIGSDVSGPVDYLFTETSGNPGATSSGWQSSTSYTDSGLTELTQYTYTVTMRDSLGNTGTASAPASATTQATPDTDPPTPNPATFAVAPAADSDTAISMTATTGSDASGPVEYLFTETSGNPSATSSAWQTSASYTDSDLTASTQYTYTVTMRDSLGNTGTASAPASATTQAASGGWTQIIYDDFESGFGNWTDGGADCKLYTGGTYAHQGSGAIDIEDNTNSSVTTTGNLALSAYDEVKVDFWYYCVSMETNEDFWLQISTNGGSSYTTVQAWAEGAEFQNGAFYQESVTITGYTLTDQTRIRFRCDASGGGDDVYIDEIEISGGSSGPDTNPPTPNPATFAVAPSADSDTAISMTATTGSDASGPVEYLFTETSGNPGGTSSGWQTGTSYTDSGLNVSTQYTYTVTMRDSLGNTGAASSPASATTQAAPDTDPPTPDPATFAVAPSDDSSTAISMTATTGSDASGPVEYLFTETSGNPGATSSSWQTSTSYTDSGLDADTQYTYTVTMRDSLGNTGTASSPASATTQAGGGTPYSQTIVVVDGWDDKNGKTFVEDGKVYVFTSSDNDRWDIEKKEYISLEFSNISFGAGATITGVTVYCEHQEESGFDSGDIEWNVGTGWPSGSTTWDTNTSIPMHTSDQTDSWDVTSSVNSTTRVNDLELRIKNNSNNKKIKPDYVYVTVDWTE
jgi:hypothetical protein